MLAGALVLGGGQGTLGDSLVQLLALALIAFCLWRHAVDPEAGLPRLAWLVVLPLLVPLLQLLPLPEPLWLLPEGRQELAAELAAAEVEAPSRWSLVPLATERALFWLLPAVALFLATLQLQASQRRLLLQLLVVLAAFNVVLGLAQLAGGPGSGLRFYSNTNVNEAVGFFANRNHLASLLAVCLPLVMAGTALWLSRREQMDARAVLGVAVGLGLVILLILGIAMARSRAGLLLGMAGLLGSLPIVLGLRRRRGTRRALVVAVSLGVMLVLQVGLFGILQRLQKDPLEDQRFRYLPIAMEVASRQAPLGAGLGGFRRAFEAADVEPTGYYVNHAHNDYVELWVDAGPLAVLVGVPVLAGLGLALWRTLRRGGGSRGARAMALSAALGLGLLALHSLGDYPLRTTAMLAVAGLLCGLLITPDGQRPEGTPTRTHGTHAA